MKYDNSYLVLTYFFLGAIWGVNWIDKWGLLGDALWKIGWTIVLMIIYYNFELKEPKKK